MGDRVEYCGYVCNMDAVKDRRQVRAKMRINNGQPLIAVMAGGGADAYRLMQTFLDALPLVGRAAQVSTMMVTGPFMPDAQRKALRDHAKALGVKIHTSIGDPMSQINAADLVVSMAGYNTLSEILRFQKNAVIVPRHGPSAEQRMRTSILAERGLVSMVDPRDLSAERLAQAIVQALHAPSQPGAHVVPCLAGIAKATNALLALLPSGRGSAEAPRKPVVPASPPIWPLAAPLSRSR
jgi:predicted glycosyltransferase